MIDRPGYRFYQPESFVATTAHWQVAVYSGSDGVLTYSLTPR